MSSTVEEASSSLMHAKIDIAEVSILAEVEQEALERIQTSHLQGLAIDVSTSTAFISTTPFYQLKEM